MAVAVAIVAHHRSRGPIPWMRVTDGLNVVSRRGVLRAGWAGLAGLSLPTLLSARAGADDLFTGTTSIALWRAH